MIPPLLKSKIVKKLLTQASLTAVILICVISAAVGISTYYQQLRLFDKKIQNIKESYLDVVRTALWLDDRESLKLALMGIKRIPGIACADVHGQEGELICKTGDEKHDESMNRIFPIVQTYNNKKQKLGTLHLMGSRSFIRQRIINAVLISMITQSLVIGFVSFAMLFVIYRSIIIKLLKITSYTATLNLESLNRALKIKAGSRKVDELDDLADSINSMRENLLGAFLKKDQAEHQLVEHQTELENIVFKRTASLKATNEKLQNEIEERIVIEQERNKLIEELQAALSDIKQLSGMLPICSSCKKIRDDKGYWRQVESYIGKHSDAQFSHSICPDCAKELYPELNLTDEELAEKPSNKDQ